MLVSSYSAQLVVYLGTPSKQRSREGTWARYFLFVLIITIVIMMLKDSSNPVVAEVG
jgi:hypothetical protein